jgi:glucose-6-phosphate 1-dehydrogenase
MVGIARFPEERIFRVDHYLGKEPVQGLLVLRFANLLFEPIWNRHHVNSVQITMTETYDVADRGSFYDTVGTIRDVIQNHLLQVMAYLAMEPPSSALAEAERNEKVKLLSAVRTADPADLIRGQYAGYLDTCGVRPGSTTETFAALRLFVDNWQWADVPFVIRAGKRLPVKTLDVIVELRHPPAMLFASADADHPPPPDSAEHPTQRRAHFAPAGQTARCGRGHPRDPGLGGLLPGSGQHAGGLRACTGQRGRGGPTPFRLRVHPRAGLAHRRAAAGSQRHSRAVQPGSWGPEQADRLAPGGCWYPVGVTAGGPVLSTR